MVLAPRPLTWCIVDWRLLDEDDGVCVRCPGDFPGERVWLMEGFRPCSGVIVEVFRNPGCCLGGACIDFALADRETLGGLGRSAPALRLADIPRRLP